MRRLLPALLLAACSSGGLHSSPLKAPTALMASNISGRVALVWIGVSGATGYAVLRSTTSGGPYAQIATTVNPGYSDSTVAGGTAYFYVVRALEGTVSSDDSQQASIVTSLSPPVLTASGTSTTLTLSWAKVTGATSYDVSRAGVWASTFTVVAANTTSPWTDAGLQTNTSYRYIVTARNAADSADSAVFWASTAPFPPTSLAATARNRRIDLTWIPGNSATSFDVLRAASAAGPYAVIGTTTSATFSDVGVPNLVPAWYIVRSHNATSVSDNSAAISATPFREICIADTNSNTVSVYDGDTGGNVAPKRQFGGHTGLSGVEAIAVDPGVGAGANGVVFIASPNNLRVNTYSRAVNGDASPVSTLPLASPPRALALDQTNSELWVGLTGEVRVYGVAAADGSLTLKRTLTLASATDVARGLALDTTHGEVMVLAAPLSIDVYPRTWTTSPARLRTLAVAPLTGSTSLRQLAYDATADGVFTLHLTTQAGVTSAVVAEYPRAPSAGCSGAPALCNNVAPLRAPLTGSPAARGLTVDGSKVFVSGTRQGQAAGAVDAYALTASGAAAPVLTLSSSSSPLYHPGPLALDSTDGQLWVSFGNSGAQAFAYPVLGCSAGACDAQTTGLLDGSSSGIFEPNALARDLTHSELLVLNQGPSPRVSIYTLGGAFNGSLFGLDTGFATSIDVDEQQRQYFVTNRGNASVLVYSSVAGMTPFDTVTGAATTLSAPNQVLFDAAAQRMIVTDQQHLLAFDRYANGNQPPLLQATTVETGPSWAALDARHDEIFVFGPTSGSVYPRNFAAGTLSPLRTLTKGGAVALDPLGDELWLLDANGATAYGRTSDASGAGLRRISGPLTGLSAASAIVVCN